MFTGLIEELGIIKTINSSPSGSVLTVACKKILEDVSLGDSICVNGVCQSVVGFGKDYFKTELSNETLQVTTFSSLKVNQKVNLERAMSLNKRLDGHIVSGHVDCNAKLLNVQNDGFSYIYTFQIDEDYKRYIIHKGSIAVNGISLTLSKVEDNVFSVAIIPITVSNTNLKELKIGDLVNIETDIIGKYVEKFLLLNNNTTNIISKIDENLLKENGFI